MQNSAKKLIQNLPILYTILQKNFHKIQNVHQHRDKPLSSPSTMLHNILSTIHNNTKLDNIVHNFESVYQLYTSLQYFTKLYNTLPNFYKTLLFFKRNNKDLAQRQRLYTTFTTLSHNFFVYKTFYKILHNFPLLYITIHNVTQMNNTYKLYKLYTT